MASAPENDPRGRPGARDFSTGFPWVAARPPRARRGGAPVGNLWESPGRSAYPFSPSALRVAPDLRCGSQRGGRPIRSVFAESSLHPLWGMNMFGRCVAFIARASTGLMTVSRLHLPWRNRSSTPDPDRFPVGSGHGSTPRPDAAPPPQRPCSAPGALGPSGTVG